jgi:hypothetical protein
MANQGLVTEIDQSLVTTTHAAALPSGQDHGGNVTGLQIIHCFIFSLGRREMLSQRARFTTPNRKPYNIRASDPL